MNRYRVDWHAGMRLTDDAFRQSDEFYVSALQPLYSVLVNGDYGFLDLPVFRYEMTDNALSITELHADAVTYSGKLIRLSFNRNERNLFQEIALPNSPEPLILYVDRTSDDTVRVSAKDALVPLCDADYKIFVKPENEHYNNPDAVPFARLIYRHGWTNDTSFIAPCVSLRANGMLLRSAANYVVELEALINALKNASETEQYVMVMSSLPVLSKIAVEVQKEADAMTPRHLITLMQEAIQVILTMAEVESRVFVPEKDRCVAFVESHYTPYVISEMVNEGIQLTHALIGLPQSFGHKPAPEPAPEPRPYRRVDTNSIRKKFH